MPNGEDAPKDIRDFYYDIIENMGISHNKYDIYIMLLSLPIRTQIRLMTAYVNSLTSNDDTNFTSSLLDVFASDIANCYDNHDEFNEIGFYNSIPLLGILLKNRKIHEGAQFLPFVEDASLNNALLAIGAHFNSLLKSQSNLVFDYWTRIGSISLAVNSMDYGISDSFELIYTVKGLIDYTQLMSVAGLRKQSSLVTGYFYARNARNTRNVQQTSRDIIVIGGKYAKRIAKNDTLIKGLDPLERFLCDLPLVGYRRGNIVSPVYSLSVLLATIGELINLSIDGKDMTTEMMRMSVFREFIVPQFIDDGESYEQDSLDSRQNEYEIIVDENQDMVRVFMEHLIRWISTYAGGVSVNMLGRISTRFYSTVERIDRQNTLGGVFHRIIVLFMNSVLIEDAIEHNIKLPEYNNTIDDSSSFSRNLVFFKKARKYLKFSEWIFNCPLLNCYIDEREDGFDYFVKLKWCYTNVYYLLDRIELRNK